MARLFVQFAARAALDQCSRLRTAGLRVWTRLFTPRRPDVWTADRSERGTRFVKPINIAPRVSFGRRVNAVTVRCAVSVGGGRPRRATPWRDARRILIIYIVRRQGTES